MCPLTLLSRQNLTWVDLHLHPAISLILVQPSVAGEHVLPSLDWNCDLDTGQEPARPQANVVMPNQYPVDLWKKANREPRGQRKKPTQENLLYVKQSPYPGKVFFHHVHVNILCMCLTIDLKHSAHASRHKRLLL